MRVRQSITIGPTPTSFEVFVPLAESVGGTHISVLTGKGKPTSLDIADYQTQFNAAVPQRRPTTGMWSWR